MTPTRIWLIDELKGVGGKTATVTTIAKHTKAILDPADHTDADVNAAIGQMSDANIVGEAVAKRAYHTRPRGLIENARKQVSNRSVGAALQEKIKSSMNDIKAFRSKPPANQTPEQVMVSVNFTSRQAAKHKLKVNGILSKATDEVKAMYESDINAVNKEFSMISDELCDQQRGAFWAAMTPSLHTVAKSLLAGTMASKDQGSHHELLQGRGVVMCLSATKDIELDVMLANNGKAHDADIQAYEVLRTALCGLIGDLDFSEQMDPFGIIQRKLWDSIVSLGLHFETDRILKLQQVGASDAIANAVDAAFADIGKAYSTAASRYLNLICAKELN